MFINPSKEVYLHASELFFKLCHVHVKLSYDLSQLPIVADVLLLMNSY